jgi:hypothetical protein
MKQLFLIICIFCLTATIAQAANTCPNNKCPANVLNDDILKMLPNTNKVVVNTDGTKVPMIFEKVKGIWVVKAGKKVVQKAKSTKAVLDNKILKLLPNKNKVIVNTEGTKVPMVFEKINGSWEIRVESEQTFPLPIIKEKEKEIIKVETNDNITIDKNIKVFQRSKKCGRRGVARFTSRIRKWNAKRTPLLPCRRLGQL